MSWQGQLLMDIEYDAVNCFVGVCSIFIFSTHVEKLNKCRIRLNKYEQEVSQYM